MTASSLPCLGIVENYLIPLITDNIIHEFGMMGMQNENCKTDWRTSTKRSTGTSDNLYPVITLTGDSLNLTFTIWRTKNYTQISELPRQG